MKLDSNYKIILFVTFLFLVLSACSRKIEIEHFRGISEVSRGEEAVLEWKFRRADYVLIDGYAKQFPAEGTLKVMSDNPKSYMFTAVNYFDTLRKEWNISMRGGIQTGGAGGAFPEMRESFRNNEFLSGVAEREQPEVERIKVMRHFQNKDGFECTLRFIALDRFGNYLHNLLESEGRFSLTTTDGANIPIVSINEIKAVAPVSNLNVMILADNSAAAERNIEISEALKDFSDAFRLIDNYTFGWINHLELNETNLSGLELNIFDNIPEPDPFGYNAFFKHTYSILSRIDASDSENKCIVVPLLFSSDNSSVFFDANDIADLARNNSTPVYPIIIGTAVGTYSYNYIADFTGAKMYFIDENSIDKVKNILHEIVFAQKSYYEISFDCRSIKSNTDLVLNYEHGETVLFDRFVHIKEQIPQFSDYQAIAGFAFKDTTIDRSFIPMINLLAEVMIINPEMTLELIGHSGIEGNERATYDLSLSRAQNVRRMLISQGVPSSQIRVVAEGSSRPIYFLEQSAWQSYYNRRVEIRWIVPEQLPYEILAEICHSEEEALGKVESWEKLGYKSYYERFLVNNFPAYRVKIWGFATSLEAERTIAELKTKFPIEFIVR